jgi:hypothetical protein
MSTEIFISYSHDDADYLKEGSLFDHLKGLERDGAQFWSDRDLNVGDDWDSIIQSRIKTTDIAVVLISQAFLNSTYIRDKEIQPFLSRSREEALIIFPVMLSASSWEQEQWLRSRQFIPSNGENIEEHHWEPPGKRKAIFKNIADALRKRVLAVEKSKQDGSASPIRAMGSLSKSINNVNQLFPQLESFHTGRPEEQREYGIIYYGKGDHIEANDRGSRWSLTPSDLQKLSERQLRHISIFQQDLEECYERWGQLYRQRGREQPNVSEETAREMRRVIAAMEGALKDVFIFLDAAGLKIDDHYYLFQSIIDTESRRADAPTGV